MPEISLIIPVFNTEETILNRAIKSVLNQTFSDFELLIIDDGSTPSTRSFLDAASKTDQRIKVVHRDHEGVSSARNAGLDLARGRFIAFLDSDDILHPSFMSDSLAVAKQSSADIVCGGILRITQAKQEVSDYFPISGRWRVLKGDELLSLKLGVFDPIQPTKLGLNRGGGELYAVYGKLFNASILTSVRFDASVVFSEDKFFTFSAFGQAQSVALTNMIWVERRHNPNSATAAIRTNALEEMSLTATKIVELAKAEDIDLEIFDQSIYEHFCRAIDKTITKREYSKYFSISRREYISRLIKKPVFESLFRRMKPVGFAQKIQCSLARNKQSSLLVVTNLVFARLQDLMIKKSS